MSNAEGAENIADRYRGLTAEDYSLSEGMRMARKAFEKRGNHSEIHLTEPELAALLSIAVGLGLVKKTLESAARNAPAQDSDR